jgi:uncharacterized protein (UPF0147 family)
MQGNASHSEKTTPKQDKLIAALLAGQTIMTAAAVAGCNETTAHAWLKLPHVRAAYQEAQRQIFDDAVNQLMLSTADARATLDTIMKDPEVPPAVRVRAGQILLEKSIELHKMSDLERKVATLEQLLKEKNP